MSSNVNRRNNSHDSSHDNSHDSSCGRSAARPPATHVILGAGPVGRAVVASLAARGIEPVVVTRSGTPVAGATSRRADITDHHAVAAAIAGAEVVFQCAQPQYHRWPQEFPGLQAGVVDAAAATGALVVVAENLYGYGPCTSPLHEDMPLAATTRKGAVRAAMWSSLEAAHQAGRIRVVAARASDFFGPGVRDSALGERFFRPLIAGQAVQVLGDPERLHSYTYVPDFGEAMVRLSETPTTWGRAWHVPNAAATSTRRLAELAAFAAGVAAPKLRRVRPWQIRLLGVAVAAIRELRELLYEFDDDFVVDHGQYAATVGHDATALGDALRTTVAAYRSDSADHAVADRPGAEVAGASGPTA